MHGAEYEEPSTSSDDGNSGTSSGSDGVNSTPSSSPESDSSSTSQEGDSPSSGGAPAGPKDGQLAPAPPSGDDVAEGSTRNATAGSAAGPATSAVGNSAECWYLLQGVAISMCMMLAAAAWSL